MKLGVNIDHVATLRQARYRSRGWVATGAEPGILEAARAVKRAGAHGLTVHLREDRRHIQDADVWLLRRKGGLPLNLEMAASPEILKIALRVRPEEVCLVPERREEVTTEGGLDVRRGGARLLKTIAALRHGGVTVSLFIAPDPRQIRAAAASGAEFIELHTGAFAEARSSSALRREVKRLRDGAELAVSLGLRVNAGHGINYTNIRRIRKIPHLETLNIGHTIVSRAIAVGMEKAVREMLQEMRSPHAGQCGWGSGGTRSVASAGERVDRGVTSRSRDFRRPVVPENRRHMTAVPTRMASTERGPPLSEP